MPKLHSEPPPPCPKLALPAASIGHNNELSSDFFRMHGPVLFRSDHVFGDSRRSRRKRVPYMFRKGCAGFGASFRRDRRTVQGLPWIFGVFQKAGAHFQKKIIKKKRHSHSQRNVQSRPTTRAASDPVAILAAVEFRNGSFHSPSLSLHRDWDWDTA